MKDKDVDEYLKELENKKYPFSGFKGFSNFKWDKDDELLDKFNEYIDYKYLSEELKLIKKIEKTDTEILFFIFTKKGRKVMRLGGWLKYLDRKEEIEKKNELKEDYELKIAEFQAKNPRLPYYIAFGSFILAMFSFIKSCSTEERTLLHKQEMKPYKKEQPILQNNNLEDSTKVLKKK
jgi:hypothetical protein